MDTIEKGAWLARWVRLGGAAVVLASLTACASFEFTKPVPKQTQPLAVRVSGEELSGWSDLPIGVYRVPDSHTIISGHQKGQAASVMFGLLGVAVVHAANASAGADLVKQAESKLRINLNKPLDAAIGELTASPQFGKQWTRTQGKGNLMLLTPALALSYVSDTDVRPFVVVKATLQAPGDSKPVWTSRYIASSGPVRPLAGPGGWIDADASALRDAVNTNIQLAVRAMAVDLANPAPRDEAKMTMAESHFPFVRQRFQVKGFQLAEDDRYLTFVPRLGDVIVFTGVNVMDKTAISYRPATKDDVVFKVVEPPVEKK